MVTVFSRRRSGTLTVSEEGSDSQEMIFQCPFSLCQRRARVPLFPAMAFKWRTLAKYFP